jgi:hypothetical protein
LNKMEEKLFLGKLRSLEKGTMCHMSWDRQNGPVNNFLRYNGFDENNVPKMYFPGGTRLNFRLIGGYLSIISLEEECPDGASVRKH